MRIHFRSDIHHKVNKGIPEADYPEADVIIVAGDIEDNSHLVSLAIARPKSQIIGVLGNHDFWYTRSQRVDEASVNEYKNNGVLDVPNLHVLEGTAIDIDGVHFIGACGWGNGGEGYADAQELHRSLNDFEYIKGWSPDEMRRRNLDARQFIAMDLKAHHDRTVVVTHFPPTTKVLAPEYKDEPSKLTQIYYSMGMDWEIDKLIRDGREPKLWIFGHSHSKQDERIGNIRFMSNCRGYERYEPPIMDPNLIVEV